MAERPDLPRQLQDALGAEYDLDRELGGGGMSRVFLAHEKRLGRRVVVKVLNPDLAAALSTERFEREIQLAAQLQDPRIVPLLNAGEAAGLPYYTMPFVEGESLRASLLQGPIDRTTAISILRDIALALEYAHARGVVHRDIKPENVLLTRRTAVVTDFGIAKAVSAAATNSREALTTVGAVMGTPAYMAPEQAAGGVVDARADLYAWGVVAYELLSGAHPFAGSPSAQAMVAAHITTKPVRLGERARDLPVALSEVIDRTLAKDPVDRPASAGEILRAMDGIAGAAPVGRARPLRTAIVIVVLAVTIGLGVRLLRPGARPPRDPSAPSAEMPRSLAVLPFANVGGDTADAYFAEGMADELTTAVSHLPGLRVVSGSSASGFRGGAVPAPEAARRLGVDAVLEGSVRRANDRIRVTARLTTARDGTVLWTDRYDRELAQVFDLQDEITRAIVSALRGTLMGTTGATAGAPRGTSDLVAYDLYLKGRYYWSRRGEPGLRTAIGFFQQAVARDSAFARGWAGLSLAQVVLPTWARVSADSMLGLATRSAGRALELDSTLAEAHLALAYALKTQWRWTESERHFRSAVAQAPDDYAVHHWYGVMLYAMGRVNESIVELTRARALDSMAGTVATDLAIGLYGARRFDDALAAVLRDYSMDPTKPDASFIVGSVQMARGRPDSALTAFESAVLRGSPFDMRAYQSVAFRRLGRVREADSAYADLLRGYRKDRSLSWLVAFAAAGAGQIDNAMAAVGEAMRTRPALLTEMSFPCDPLLDPLRHDARFARLLEGAGMRPCPP